MKTTKCAVLMGDIVMSRQSEDLFEVHKAFNREVSRINNQITEDILSPLTITLGDEFQGLVVNLQTAFSYAMLLRHALLMQDVNCRFVVGVVEIQTKVNKEIAWNMMGPGLAEARDALNNKENPNCYRFSLGTEAPIEILLNSVGMSLSSIESKWTYTQLAYISELLDQRDLTKRELSKKLRISENTLYKSLRSADFQLYEEQTLAVLAVLRLLDQSYFK